MSEFFAFGARFKAGIPHLLQLRERMKLAPLVRHVAPLVRHVAYKRTSDCDQNAFSESNTSGIIFY